MENINSFNVTEELKLLRIRRKLTQKQVAQKLDVSTPTYMYYENHPNEFKIGMISKLCDILNYNLYGFFLSNIDTKCNILESKKET